MADQERQEDIIRVLRLVEYEGLRSLVEEQVANSIHGTRYGMAGRGLRQSWPKDAVRITAVTLNEFPEVLEEARRTPVPELLNDLAAENNRLREWNSKLKAQLDGVEGTE